MPIRPQNRKRYPKDWKQISERIRFKRAEGRCECTGECGVCHYGEADDDGTDERCAALHGKYHPVTESYVILTVAHLDHTPENCDDDNLKAMCQRCHNRYDAPKRREGIRHRERERMACGDLFEGRARG